MTIYEKRTYSVKIGQMPEVSRLYSEEGWPAINAGGFGKYLVGYFISDTGPLHQLVHLWRFDSDSERRDFWNRLFSDEKFMAFAVQIRPLLDAQEVQLLHPAPWGPRP
ncbi:MAG: NIPSNAP family protein [Desulfobacterales bacterium]|nr:NIPSNAP family protein [Desulfobacterales bacterium]